MISSESTIAELESRLSEFEAHNSSIVALFKLAIDAGANYDSAFDLMKGLLCFNTIEKLEIEDLLKALNYG